MKKITLTLLFSVVLTGCSGQSKKDVLRSDSNNKTSETIEAKSAAKEVKKEATAETSTPSEIGPQVSYHDFVGLWGIPYSEFVFSINADGTVSNFKERNVHLNDMVGSLDNNGNPVLSYTSTSGIPAKLTKNTDGTLSFNNDTYSYLGNMTIEELMEQNAQTIDTNSVSEDSQTEPSNEPEYAFIEAGDQFDTFGIRFGLTADELSELNPGVDPVNLSPQRLRVK